MAVDTIIRTVSLDAGSIRRAVAKSEDGTESEDTGAPINFSGHAALFDQPALIGSRDWGFVEWIERGAFSDVLDDDVRFLFNHDGVPLARTTNGTLKLSEDKTGLFSEAELAPVQLSRDLATLIERGDVSQMSFAFVPDQMRTGRINNKDPKEAGHDKIPGLEEFDGLPYNVVTKMSRLYDVSAVTYPAYEGTDAAISNAVRERARVIRESTVARGTVLSAQHVRHLRRKINLALREG